jgi:tRNA-splicing ligase RtcB
MVPPSYTEGDGMKIFATDADDKTLQQMQNCLDAEPGTVGALMGDAHFGYGCPIGAVLGHRSHYNVTAVGVDIACGVKAVRTNLLDADIPQVEMERLADEMFRRIAFGAGRKNPTPVTHAHVYDRIAASPFLPQRGWLDKARQQLGTVGGGNHYVDVLVDQNGALWFVTHFGSRGFGFATANAALNLAHGLPVGPNYREQSMDPPTLLEVGSPLGEDYLEAMRIAGDYAYAGRDAVIDTVLQIFGAEAEWMVHNHHNFIWDEQHQTDRGLERLWVARKGATPAFPKQAGFVGGSMGDMSAVVQGAYAPGESEASLHSTIHGAGRLLGRMEAKGKRYDRKQWTCLKIQTCDGTLGTDQFQFVVNGPRPKCPKCDNQMQIKAWVESTPGKVNFEAVKGELHQRRIIVRGGAADEAPACYRPLESVLAAQGDTIDVVDRLQPRIVLMADDGGESRF